MSTMWIRDKAFLGHSPYLGVPTELSIYLASIAIADTCKNAICCIWRRSCDNSGMTEKRPRGRPPKFAEPAPLAHLFHILEHGKCGFAEACRRARTTPHLVKRAMQAHPEVEFEFRVACLRPPRKRLGERWGRPEIVLEAALEAHRLEHGEPPRTWEQVQASIRRRAEARAGGGETLGAATVQAVTIPPARDALEENF